MGLVLILHIFVGSTLAGSAVIAALVMGVDSVSALLSAAGFGFALAFPASWLVAKQIRAGVKA